MESNHLLYLNTRSDQDLSLIFNENGNTIGPEFSEWGVQRGDNRQVK